MQKTFRVKLASRASERAEVFEQELLQDLVDRFATRRHWKIEELVEANQAGWIATAAEGDTEYGLSLTVPAGRAESSPSSVIEWSLVVEASRDL